MKTADLIKRYPIISDQVDARELSILLTELEQLLKKGVTGTVVEFGCYAGTTSLFIRRLLDAYKSDSVYHVYDSFEGLPEKTEHDKSVAGDQFIAGELCASRKLFMENFKKAGLRPPVVHKGWFSQMHDDAVPSDIMFAFLDGDYYESIRDSLRLVTPKLVSGAVVVIDDYMSEALPGAAVATDEWAKSRGYTIRRVASLAIIVIP